MNIKKYELLVDTEITVDGHNLYKIKAITDIINSKGELVASAGEIGGYIEKEKNLSHEHGAWISGDLKITAMGFTPIQNGHFECFLNLEEKSYV